MTDGPSDGRLAEMKIYKSLGRHPRTIVAYHGHVPVAFGLLLQFLPGPKVDPSWYSVIERAMGNKKPEIREKIKTVED